MFKTDVVLVRANDNVNISVGQLWVLASVGNKEFALISKWELVSSHDHMGVAVWAIVDSPVLCSLEAVLSPLLWCESGSGQAHTLIPLAFRGFQCMSD